MVTAVSRLWTAHGEVTNDANTLVLSACTDRTAELPQTVVRPSAS